MSTLRQAAQAVIERWDSDLWRNCGASMNKLRTALAATEQEPDAPLLHTFLNEAQKAGVTHLVQPKKPEQDPVAYWVPKAEQFCLPDPNGQRPFARAWEPLYAAPVDIDAITKERDALAAEVARLDAGWHKANGHTLDAALERDELMQAAKLALDALGVATTPIACDRQEVLKAIAALKKAGV